ncbi:MAG: hypothetical protein GXN96_00350 [Aquificae bacterium]|nr:hypothetical protein [Aquificota bacterium]
MEELCPRCGRLLSVVDCCGGGIWYCENCREYYYYGELIPEEEFSCEILPPEDSQEENQQPSE